MNSLFFDPKDSDNDDYDYEDKSWEDVLEDIYTDLGLNLANGSGERDD